MQMCRSTKVMKQIDLVEALSSTPELEYGLYTNSAENPYKVTVNVNGKSLTMEIQELHYP